MNAWTVPNLVCFCFALALAGAFVSRRAYRDLFSPIAIFVFGYGGLYLLGMLRWALLDETGEFDDAASVSAVGVVFLGLISFVAVKTSRESVPVINLKGYLPRTSADGVTLVLAAYSLITLAAFVVLIVLA